MKPVNRREQVAAGPSPAAPEIPRDAKGRFTKGFCPNPRGRPRAEGEVRAAAQAHGLEAIERLVHLMFDGKPDRVQVAAAEAILDRAYGRPPASVTVSGEVSEHRSFELTTRLIAEHPELVDAIFAAAARRELVQARAAARREAEALVPAGRRERVAEAVEGAEAQG